MTTSLRGNNPISIHIDPLSDAGVGAVAVGNLVSVHESSLFLAGELPFTGHKTVFDVANPLLPQRVPFKEWKENPGDFGTAFSCRGDGPNFSLLPALAGVWLVAPLTDRRGHTCGAVYWHRDTVGTAAEDAARIIQRDICVKGNAGMYNVNEEPREYEEMGGRLVGRYAWDSWGKTPINSALDEGSPHKLDTKEYEKAVWGPDFLFAPAQTYLERVWTSLQNLSAYGAKPDDYDPSSPNPRLWHNTNGDPAYVRGLFESQEYLAGRILTTTKRDRQVAHMLVVFTYDCPQDMDDAFVLDQSVSGPKAAPLTKTEGEDRSGLIPFALVTDETSLKEALESISSHKILDLLEWEILRNEKTPVDDLVKVVRRIVPVLQSGLENVPTPLLLFLNILSGLKPPLMEAFVLSMSADVLSVLVRVSQSNYDDKKDPYNPGYPPRPAVLLVNCPSLECAVCLLRAGVVPDVETVGGAMSRHEIFAHLAARLLEKAHDRDAMLVDLAFEAAKGLHARAMEWILRQLSSDGQIVLPYQQTTEILGPVPLWDQEAPPATKGTLPQVVMGSFAMKHSEHLEYLWVVKRCEEQNASGGGVQCTMATRAEPDTFEKELIDTVDATVRFGGSSFDRTRFDLPKSFWDEVGHIKRGCGLGGKKISDKLAEKHGEMLDRFESHFSAAALDSLREK